MLKKILVVQTAFIGDVILTLPLVQSIKKFIPDSEIHFLTIPYSAGVTKNHPDITSCIIYDKHGVDKGIKGFLRKLKELRAHKYDIAFVPHRSFRSALLVFLSNINLRIGFDVSSGRFLFNRIIKYKNNLHEIERNLSLLEGLSLNVSDKVYPRLYPDINDVEFVDKIFSELKIDIEKKVCVAPGSVWNTKRWSKEGYIELIKKLTTMKIVVFLIGGKEDYELCRYIENNVNRTELINLCGRLTLLQSAEIMRRSQLLITNDSAPVHIASAMDTPVVEIYGPTTPKFGFYPYSSRSVVLEVNGLDCRPCRIHGSRKCPTGKFECMTQIKHEEVMKRSLEILGIESLPGKFDKDTKFS